MKTFNVIVSRQAFASIEVEAETEEQAVALAMNQFNLRIDDLTGDEDVELYEVEEL